MLRDFFNDKKKVKAAINTSCAAIHSVAALELVLNKHKLVHLDTSAAPSPACGQTSVLSWWKVIYYVYKTERGGAQGGAFSFG